MLVAKTKLLFAQTLQCGYDSHAAWAAVSTLREDGRRFTFERAALWLSAGDPLKRARGADIICQMRRRTHCPSYERPELYREEALPIVSAMVAVESNKQALVSGIYALGHLHDDRCVPFVVPYAGHSDADVRFAVAFTLADSAQVPQALEALVVLMEDEDREVRDWAIFGVGIRPEVDSERLREVFLAHVDDPYFDARLEAIAALAERKDLRAVVPLISFLARYGPIYSLVSAARVMLEMEEDQPGWFSQEYISALESSFPAQAAEVASRGLRISRL